MLHNDDTSANVLELLGARRDAPFDDVPEERTGTFTTGIVSPRNCETIECAAAVSGPSGTDSASSGRRASSGEASSVAALTTSGGRTRGSRPADGLHAR